MELLALVPLVFMIRSDFRERVVGVCPLFLFGILVLGTGCFVWGWQVCLMQVVQNGGVLAFLTVGVLLYLGLRYRRGMGSLREYIGSGDAWFLLFLTPAFGMMEYVWFLVVSFSLTLLGWLIYRLMKGSQRGIPLVSTVGCCYVIYVPCRLIFSF